MSTNLTEGTGFTATVPVLDDGDALTAAGLIAMAQPLADRTRHLLARLPDSVVPVSYAVHEDSATSSGWLANHSFNTWVCTTTGGQIKCRAVLPPKGTVTAITAYIAGDAVGTTAYVTLGGLPGIMPYLNVRSRDVAVTQTWTNHGTMIDPSATAAALDAQHPIILSGLGITLTPTTVFDLRVAGPDGAGYQDDKTGLLGFTADVTF